MYLPWLLGGMGRICYCCLLSVDGEVYRPVWPGGVGVNFPELPGNIGMN